MTPLLDTYLKKLRLSSFLEHYQSFAKDAALKNLDYPRYLLALAEQEVEQRERNRIKRLIRGAHFPVQKELADFDFSQIPKLSKSRILDLAQGAYIEDKEPLILIGNPGLGKTHLATSLGLSACRQGYKVRFWTAARLVGELLTAQQEQRFPKMLNSALKMNLVIIDELGFIPFSSQGAHAIFTFCSELYEQVAIIITTNLKFADWVQVFGSERLTAALIDRLTHRAHILELIGESFRFRQQLQADQQL